ncbi:MAG: putative quinol monooxygenase [Candidatus Sphingomonas colombiensis]|nr:putative quinol monooxygenase [Sphingomonas sp.]WEK44459.1 MAG: putative quinol monooxygenase [Sphingomonas sp.]
MKIGVIASFKAQPGHRAELVAALQENIAVVRANEPGCLRCDVFTSIDHSEQVSLVEVYASEEAFETHRSAPYGAELFARVKPHMDGLPVADRFHIAE